MNDETDKVIIDFLKDGVSHLENRINLLDNKASIFIAIQTGLIAFFTYIIKEIFLIDNTSKLNLFSHIALGVALIIFSMIVLLLINVIRPKGFSFNLGYDFKKFEVDNYIFWFNKKFPNSPEAYKEMINTLDLSKIRENYEKAHFTDLELIRNKYVFYRMAVFGMKLLILWIFICLLILTVLKWNLFYNYGS